MGKVDGCSIVISVYNGTAFLPELLSSIESQLSVHDEVLIYDDGSTDGSLDYLLRRGYNVLTSFDSPYFKLKSEGTQERITRNFFELINISANDIIVLVDQDDIWLDGKLDMIRNNPGYDLYVHDAQVINSQGEVLFQSYQDSIGGYSNSLFRNLIINRFLGCCMAFNKKACFSSLPEIIDDYCYHDQILGLILLDYNVYYENRQLLSYRRHKNTVTTSGFKGSWNLKKKLFHRFKILKFIIGVKSSPRK